MGWEEVDDSNYAAVTPDNPTKRNTFEAVLHPAFSSWITLGQGCRPSRGLKFLRFLGEEISCCYILRVVSIFGFGRARGLARLGEKCESGVSAKVRKVFLKQMCALITCRITWS